MWEKIKNNSIEAIKEENAKMVLHECMKIKEDIINQKGEDLIKFKEDYSTEAKMNFKHKAEEFIRNYS